jgi:transposase
LDTLNPATAGEARRSTIMARKNYTDDFRRQAVDLYRSTPGATLRGIAADLGISRHTLHEWVRAQTATAGTADADAMAGGASHPGRTGGPGHRRGRLSPEAELGALRAREIAFPVAGHAAIGDLGGTAVDGDLGGDEAALVALCAAGPGTRHPQRTPGP